MSVKKNQSGSRLAKPEKQPKVRAEKQPKARTERKPLSRTDKVKIVVIVILALILALMVGGIAAYRSLVKAPDLPSTSEAVKPGQTTVETPGDDTVQPDDTDVTPVGDRKDDFYTFLIVGRDTGGGGNTDTLMLGAYDVANQKLSVMSIPRDTMVNVPWDIKRINSVYGWYGGKEKGMAALKTEIGQLVGFEPDYYVTVEWKAVGELVDAIGGVDFDVPYYMDYDDSTQNLHIHLNKGMQHLDGDKAMQMLRWRQNSKFNEDGSYTLYNTVGDTGRIKIQQDFLKTVLKQCLQIQNVTRIKELAQVFTDNVTTDLTIGNMVWFAEQAVFGGLTMENVNFMSMPGNYEGYAWSATYQNNQSYVYPDGEALLAAINEGFNPYREDLTLDQLDIMSKNSDGSLSSTTGVVEDTTAAKAPVKKPKPSTTTSDPEPTQTEDPTTSTDVPDWLGGGDEGGETTGGETTQEPDVTQPGTSDVPSDPTVEPTPAPTPTPTPEVTPTPVTDPDPAPSEDYSEIPEWLRP